jgi:FkbM family methyltransferase
MKFLLFLRHLKERPRWLFRLMMSRILLHTRLCLLFKIKLGEVSLRFFPTRFSADLWFPSKNIYKEYRLPFLKDGDTAVDVGANIGFTTLLFGQLVGEKGQVYAFEPNPKVFSYLQYNVKVNNFKNVQLYNYACGEEPAELFLSDCGKSDTDKYLTKVECKERVKVITLDHILDCKVARNIKLLKVDTEGYEKFVFLGATRILQKTVCVIFEGLREHYARFGYEMMAVVEILQDLGFNIYSYRNTEHSFHPFDLNEYLLSSSDYSQDFFAVRSSSLLNGVQWV